jgi:phosphoglycerate dehydrogenase-like enzyme
VPLVLDDVIRKDVLPKEWVKEGSVEHFWQSNKVIVVPHES